LENERGTKVKELDDLRDHIEALIVLFDEYKGLLSEKEQTLISGEYDELNEITHEEEIMVISIDSAERKRDELSGLLCDALHIDRGSSVSDIAESLGEEEGTKFMLVIAKLLECLQEISYLHYNIERMITFQLKNIRLLTDTATGQERINTYNVKGKYQQDIQKKMFNGKG